MLVLETHGRRSHRQRRTPVQYLRHGVEFLIVASNAGHREPPAWSLNLQRQPTCRALVDGHWRGGSIPDLKAGEMWNSNSVAAWLIATAGMQTDQLRPPSRGRA